MSSPFNDAQPYVTCEQKKTRKPITAAIPNTQRAYTVTSLSRIATAAMLEVYYIFSAEYIRRHHLGEGSWGVYGPHGFMIPISPVNCTLMKREIVLLVPD